MDANTLGNFTDGRKNNLDFLRLIAAFLVLFSHSFPLLGLGEPGPPFYQNTYGGLGVDILFIISGFLITQSYLRSSNPARYLWSRFLRIFPALVVVVLLTVFVLGPIVTSLPKSAYFANGQTYSYLSMLTLYDVKYFLPGVFNHNPYPSAVNGSLWILEYMFSFYLVVLLLGVTKILPKRRVILGCFLVTLVLTYFNIGKSVSIYTLNLYYVIELFTYFGFGMVAYLYRDQITLRWDAFLFVVALLVLASLRNGFTTPLFVFLVGYLILFIGYSPGVNIRWLTRFGDFSYGVYICAFPVQQTVIHFFGGRTNAWTVFFVSGAITLALAASSWHLIEKRMLRLKGARFIDSPKKSQALLTLQKG